MVTDDSLRKLPENFGEHVDIATDRSTTGVKLLPSNNNLEIVCNGAHDFCEPACR